MDFKTEEQFLKASIRIENTAWSSSMSLGNTRSFLAWKISMKSYVKHNGV